MFIFSAKRKIFQRSETFPHVLIVIGVLDLKKTCFTFFALKNQNS